MFLTASVAAFALAFALVLIAPVTGCGFANGAGVGHPLYDDEVSLCRWCAEKNELCIEREDGSLGCSEMSYAEWCSAAQSLFFKYEPEGPFLSPKRGVRDWDFGLRTDCPEGRESYIVEAFVYDEQGDTSFGGDWDSEFDDEAIGERVALVLPDNSNAVPPQSWRSQTFTSTGGDVAHSIEITFCLSFALDEEAIALQVVDDTGHHSNAVCYGAP